MLDHVEWHTQSRIIYTQFSETLSLDDIVQANEQSYALIDREGHEDGVYAIVDVTRCKNYGSDLMSLNSLNGTSHIHPRLRWLVGVEEETNPVFRFLAISVIKILRLKYALVRTPEEALTYIYHLDPSLAQL